MATESEFSEDRLCSLAVSAMRKSYAPYSNFNVGAALLTADHRVYLGANIENASFSATVCAERVALQSAVFDGARNFTMLAIAGGKDGEITAPCQPCGVCRQALCEFCGPDLRVLLVKPNGKHEEYTLAEIFPLAFKM